MTQDKTTKRAIPPVEDEEDVEGHAFKWQVVNDPKTGDRKLRAGWTPDEPQGKPATSPRNPKAG